MENGGQSSIKPKPNEKCVFEITMHNNIAFKLLNKIVFHHLDMTQLNFNNVKFFLWWNNFLKKKKKKINLKVTCSEKWSRKKLFLKCTIFYNEIKLKFKNCFENLCRVFALWW